MKTKPKTALRTDDGLGLQAKARIVITAFNSHEDLAACTKALTLQTRTDFEVVIVNNDPDDEKFNQYVWPDKRFYVLTSKENTGFSGGSNLGALGAKTDWVITLNPDTRPSPTWFEVLMETAKAHPDYAMLSSTLINAHDKNKLDGAGDVYSVFGITWRGGQGKPLTDIGEENWNVLSPCGAAGAYKRDAFERVGGFDPKYFCYLEDVDLALRLQLQGERCLHVVDATVLHFGSGSTGECTKFEFYHTYKNQVRLMIKTAPAGFLVIMLPAYGLTLGWILLRTNFQPNWKARLRGVLAGWRHLPSHLRARKTVQKYRKISLFQFASWLAWSPRALRRKDVHDVKVRGR